MASSSIRLPITQDTLYSGNKWASGSKTINWEKYDFIVFRCQTNSENPVFWYDTKLGNNKVNCPMVVYDTVGSAGWLYAMLQFTFSANTIAAVEYHNNANWTLGCIKIIGVKIN